MNKRRWARVVGGAGMLLATACLALYLALPWYAALLLNRFVLPEGFRLQRLEFSYPGWRSQDIEVVEVFAPSLGRLTVEDISIEYDLLRLLDGDIDRVHIEKVVVTPLQQPSESARESSDFAQFLPERLLAQVPIGQLTIDAFDVDLEPWHGESLQLSLNLNDQHVTVKGRLNWPTQIPAPLLISARVDKHNHWQLTGQFEQTDNMGEFGVNLGGAIDLQDEQLMVRVANDGRMTASLSLLGPEYAKGVVELAFPEGLNLQLPRTELPSAWLFQGVIAGRYNLNGRASADWTIRNPVWDQNEQSFSSEIAVVSRVNEWHLPDQGPHLHGIKVAFAGRVDAKLTGSEQTAQIMWSQQQEVFLEAVTAEQWRAEKLQLTLPPQTVALSLQEVQFSPLQASIAMDALHGETADKETVSLQSISFTLAVEQLTPRDLKFDAAVSRLSLSLPQEPSTRAEPITVPPLQLSGRWKLSEPGQKVDFQLNNACGASLLTGDWRQLPDGQQHLKAGLDYTFTNAHSLRRRLNLPGLTWDLVEGGLTGQLVWQSTAATAPILSVQGRGLSGYLPTGRFDGVQFQLRSDRITSFLVDVHAELMEMGVAATDIQLDGQLRQLKDNGQWQFALHSASAGLLGGRVLLDDQTLNVNVPSTLILEADRLDLKRLIETQQLEGVVAEGLISGTIPVTLDNFVFSVSDGFVQAVQGGVIQYQNPLGSDAINPDLQLALDVLSNFNYQVLESSVEYSPEGTLKLTSRIEGSNPDVAGGKRVNLNLNTELDLKSAFYALRLQSGLDQLLSDHFTKPSQEDSDRFCEVIF